MIRKTFTFRSSWYEAMGKMSDTQRLSLMDAICRYAIDGDLPQAMAPVVEIAFILIRAEIDAVPNRSRKKEPQPQPVPEPEPEPQPEPQPEISNVAQKPQPEKSKIPAIDFDEAYYNTALSMCSDHAWRDLILDKLPVVDFDVLIEEFRDYIIEHGRTGEFTEESLSERRFCQKLIDSLDNGFIPSDMAIDQIG